MSLSSNVKLVELRRLLSIQYRLESRQISTDDVAFSKKKADEGLPRAQYVYAYLLTHRIATQGDNDMARKYLDLAFEKGDHDILNLLSDLYFIHGDHDKVRACFTKAKAELDALSNEEDAK
ncbi:MAG: hypothetical protein WC968_01390 [Bacilli bacterium]